MALNLANVGGAPLDAPADCTLACDEGHLTAHKIVLCAHSRYLQDILSKFPHADHPIIVLTELNITDIKILVNYMYTGELVITNDGSPTSLLRAAQILKIDSLTDFDDDEDEPRNERARQAGHQGDEDEEDDDEEDDVMDVEDGPLSNGRANADAEDEDEDDNDNDNENEENLSGIGTGSDVDQNHDPNHHRNRINNNNNNNHSLHHLHQLHNHHSPLIRPEITKSINNINIINDNNNNNKIRCHLCNIGLSDVKCLYRHVLTRHLPEKWGYKCEFCDREFSRDDHLMRHYTTKHKNMEFNREKIRETRRLNREMAKNFHDQISTIL